jgi:hypothetical protein
MLEIIALFLSANQQSRIPESTICEFLMHPAQIFQPLISLVPKFLLNFQLFYSICFLSLTIWELGDYELLIPELNAYENHCRLRCSQSRFDL